MSTKRPPPAYLEYASDMSANNAFRLLPAAHRGVLYSLRLASWVSLLSGGKLPSDAATLARLVGLSQKEVAAALPVLLDAGFLAIDERGSLVCEELRAYHEQLIDGRDRMSEGGKRGFAAKLAKASVERDPSRVASRDPSRVASRVASKTLEGSVDMKCIDHGKGFPLSIEDDGDDDDIMEGVL